MKSEKEKLSAKSVEQLRASYKRMGGKMVNGDGKVKTKVDLINGIVMKNRLAGKSMGGTATVKKATAKKTMAKKPTVKNTSYTNLPKFNIYSVKNLAPTSNGIYRIKITDMMSGESVTMPFKGKKAFGYLEGIDYLKSIGIKIIGLSKQNDGTVLLYTKDSYKRIK